MFGRRSAAIISAAVMCAPFGSAAICGVWLLSGAEKAPVLLTGEIIGVHKAGRADIESAQWGHEIWRMVADIRVLRSFKPLAQDRIQLTFLEYAPAQATLSPVPLPVIEPGTTMVLPLKTNSDPSKPWELLDKQACHLTIPATADMPDSAAALTTAHAFLLRELSNVLVHGSRTEMLAAGRYLQQEPSATGGELLPLIESQIASNAADQWTGIVTALITGDGIPRPTFAELRDQKASVPDWALLARAVIDKLGDAPATDSLIIEKLLADASINAWGAAMSLVEFGDRPVLIDRLRQALRDDGEGTVYIAWTLAHSGHTAFLGDALPRALRVLSQPVRTSDGPCAAMLLRDFGSDQQLQQVAALARKYQTTDRDFYTTLWQFSLDNEHPPRNARVLDVVLSDRTPMGQGFDGLRVCDYAAGILARAVGEDPGWHAASKDDAIARARAWLDAHHIPR